jgi:hypothetical protein
MTDYDDDDGTVYEDEAEEGYDYSGDPNVRAIVPEPDNQPVAAPQRRETVIPIGEAVTPETLHGVVAFTRSLNLGSRDNNAHFRCELPFVVQPQWKPDQVAAQAADTFYQCVAVVLQQAGLPFTISDDGVLHEVVQAFTGAKPVEQRAERQESSSGSSSRFPHPADMRRPEHISEGMWRDLCENYDDWYDNRADKASGEYAAGSPDFKRKDDGKGLWITPFRREGGGNRGGGGHARSGGRRYED